MDLKWREEKGLVVMLLAVEIPSVTPLQAVWFHRVLCHSNESERGILGSVVQTCKYSSSASEASPAVAVSFRPVPLVLEAAHTHLLFPQNS